MKNLYYFIKWQLKRFDPIDSCFFSAFIFLGLAWLFVSLGFKTLAAISVIITMILFLCTSIYVMIIRPIRDSYQLYKREQKDTFKKLEK